MPQNLICEKSTLVQVMAWCRQASSHYLSQCWPRSMSPCGVTRPQWVKIHYEWLHQQTLLQHHVNSQINATPKFLSVHVIVSHCFLSLYLKRIHGMYTKAMATLLTLSVNRALLFFKIDYIVCLVCFKHKCSNCALHFQLPVFMWEKN